jgi:Protein of unknown function (DUF3179)
MSFLRIALSVLILIEVARVRASDEFVARPGLYPALTEPPCSYCVNENRKGFIRAEDRVLAWIRAAHNGGAFPLRHFIAGPRVINDTYGLFFYDPDGGYVAAYAKDYGYEFYGWRRGVMVVRSADGTIWSALSGAGLDGPQKGKRLTRMPNFLTTWGHWLMLHPESTAYDLFDGARYTVNDLPAELHPDAQKTLGAVDPRLPKLANVLGVEGTGMTRAYPLDDLPERACYTDRLGDEPIAVFWYGPTRSAIAYSARLNGRTLSLFADGISPETAPFKDRETETRWTLAGRGVDGPLRGQELTWVPGVQCRWYAWAAEYPETQVHAAKPQSPH